MLSLQRLPLFSYIWIHNVLFQANLESPIIFDRSLPRSPRSSATSVESALDLSPLQQELNLVGTKFPPGRAQTFRPFPQYHGCQTPILGYDNIPLMPKGFVFGQQSVKV